MDDLVVDTIATQHSPDGEQLRLTFADAKGATQSVILKTSDLSEILCGLVTEASRIPVPPALYDEFPARNDTPHVRSAGIEPVAGEPTLSRLVLGFGRVDFQAILPLEQAYLALKSLEAQTVADSTCPRRPN